MSIPSIAPGDDEATGGVVISTMGRISSEGPGVHSGCSTISSSCEHVIRREESSSWSRQLGACRCQSLFTYTANPSHTSDRYGSFVTGLLQDWL
jgi:hypothetical protein